MNRSMAARQNSIVSELANFRCMEKRKFVIFSMKPLITASLFQSPQFLKQYVGLRRLALSKRGQGWEDHYLVGLLRSVRKCSSSFIENRETSTRRVAQATDVSRRSIGRILKKNNYHPYKSHGTQELKDGDYERRLDYCEKKRLTIDQ